MVSPVIDECSVSEWFTPVSDECNVTEWLTPVGDECSVTEWFTSGLTRMVWKQSIEQLLRNDNEWISSIRYKLVRLRLACACANALTINNNININKLTCWYIKQRNYLSGQLVYQIISNPISISKQSRP